MLLVSWWICNMLYLELLRDKILMLKNRDSHWLIEIYCVARSSRGSGVNPAGTKRLLMKWGTDDSRAKGDAEKPPLGHTAPPNHCFPAFSLQASFSWMELHSGSLSLAERRANQSRAWAGSSSHSQKLLTHFPSPQKSLSSSVKLLCVSVPPANVCGDDFQMWPSKRWRSDDLICYRLMCSQDKVLPHVGFKLRLCSTLNYKKNE